MRKKAWLSLVLCALLMLTLSVSAFAEGRDQLAYIADTAMLMSDEDCGSLNSLAAMQSERYGCGIYVVTVPDYRQYSTAGISQAAEAIYDSCRLGLGEERNALILLLSMEDRDYDLCAYGALAHYAFTDFGKNQLSDVFLDNFRHDDWVGGFTDFIATAGQYLGYAEQGTPVDVPQAAPVQRAPTVTRIPIYAAISALIAAVFCFAMSRGMKTAVTQKRADSYLGDTKMNVRKDYFVRRTRTVRVIETPKSGGGHGGGGTHINSGGFSHHSGKF